MAHGAQKLFGCFGGYGLDATGQWMASIGLQPGVAMALLASLILAITMIVAIFSMHCSL